MWVCQHPSVADCGSGPPAHVHNFPMIELHDEWDTPYNEMYNNMYAEDYTFGANTAYAHAAFVHKQTFTGVFCIWPQRFSKAVIPTLSYFICIHLCENGQHGPLLVVQDFCTVTDLWGYKTWQWHNTATSVSVASFPRRSAFSILTEINYLSCPLSLRQCREMWSWQCWLHYFSFPYEQQRWRGLQPAHLPLLCS